MAAKNAETTLAETIGHNYIEGSHNEATDRIREIYRTMADINREWFEAIPIPVVFTEDDPYESYDDMKESVERDGVMKIFAGGTHPEFWTKEENLQNRAVHDYWGHLQYDVDFSFAGEFKKWFHSRDKYPARCHGVFFAEVVGQTGAAYYLEDGFGDDRFEQRAIEMSPYWIETATDVLG